MDEVIFPNELLIIVFDTLLDTTDFGFFWDYRLINHKCKTICDNTDYGKTVKLAIEFVKLGLLNKEKYTSRNIIADSINLHQICRFGEYGSGRQGNVGLVLDIAYIHVNAIWNNGCHDFSIIQIDGSGNKWSDEYIARSKFLYYLIALFYYYPNIVPANLLKPYVHTIS